MAGIEARKTLMPSAVWDCIIVRLVLQRVAFLCLVIYVYLRLWDDSNQLHHGALIRIVFGLA